MSITVLYPRFDAPAIEERTASRQTQQRLRRGRELGSFAVYDADADAAAADAVAGIATPHVLVVTDPLVLVSSSIGVRLREVLETTGAAAAVPVTNEAHDPRQRRPAPAAYLTLRELEEAFARIESAPPQAAGRTTWGESDPAVYLCRPSALATAGEPLRHALRGRDVAVDEATFVHTWSALRGQSREDVLPFLPAGVRSLLDVGCGEGGLGALVKGRAPCRVVGIELDRRAAAIARQRLDEVHCGDVGDVVPGIRERFECIVAGDVVEHVTDPWSLIAALRRVTVPGGRLVLSIPNVAHASIAADLLRGRFDYVYMGPTCAGHLRFFTRATVEEMLAIAGWTVERVVAQELPLADSAAALLATLRAAGVESAEDELRAAGYYVVARNDAG